MVEYTFSLNSEISDYIKVYKVGYVPSELPAYETANDDNYLTLEPCNLPDPLFPVEDNKITLEKEKYLTLWIDLNIPEDAKVGAFSVEFTLVSAENVKSSAVFNIEIKDITTKKY